MLSELDEEFGVSELVSEDISREKQRSYRSSDLKGLKVEHSLSKFKEGTSVILTLKDGNVLDEEVQDEQILVNVNMQDDERTAKSNENKRRGTNYQAYAEPGEEGDEDAWMRAPAVLGKYDTVIDGERRNQFTLDTGGAYGGQHERALDQMRSDRVAAVMTLEGCDHRLASDFFTESEMDAKFKKRKRRIKSVRRPTAALTADELLAMDADGVGGGERSDLGSRNRSKVKSEPKDEDSSIVAGEVSDPSTESQGPVKLDLSQEPVTRPKAAVITGHDSEEEDSDTELSKIILEPDEAQEELQRALAKVRRTQQRKQQQERTSQLAAIVRKREADEVEDHKSSNGASASYKATAAAAGGGSSIVLNTMTEFCRSIGEFGSHEERNGQQRGWGGMMAGDEDSEGEGDEFKERIGDTGGGDDMDVDDGEMAGGTAGMSSSAVLQGDQGPVGGGWQEVDAEYPLTVPVSLDTSRGGRGGGGGSGRSVRGVLDDEPQLTQGLAAALALASKKGYIDHDRDKIAPDSKLVNLMAKHFVQEEIRYDDIDSKFRKRDRFSGPLTDFKEKSEYKPEVQLKYVDDAGRELNTKEAFRQLSHRFHGKGSGKKKTEKRMKKVQDDILMKCMSSSDTPLGTVDKLHKKLETEKQAYVVLSGRNANQQKKLSK